MCWRRLHMWRTRHAVMGATRPEGLPAITAQHKGQGVGATIKLKPPARSFFCVRHLSRSPLPGSLDLSDPHREGLRRLV